MPATSSGRHTRTIGGSGRRPGVIREVCLVGVPHEKWGETPSAFVVLEPGVEVTEEELAEVTRAGVGSVKKITSDEFVDAFPKSGVDKIFAT